MTLSNRLDPTLLFIDEWSPRNDWLSWRPQQTQKTAQNPFTGLGLHIVFWKHRADDVVELDLER